MRAFVTVTLKIHGGRTETIADYVGTDGRFVGIGAQARAAIGSCRDVHYVTSAGVETIIPYHAIVSVSFEKGSHEYIKPDDAFCNPVEVCTTGPCAEQGEPTVEL